MNQETATRYKRLLASARLDAPAPESLERTAMVLGLSSAGAVSSLLAANQTGATAVEQSAAVGAAKASGAAELTTAIAPSGTLSAFGVTAAAKGVIASVIVGGFVVGGTQLAFRGNTADSSVGAVAHPSSPPSVSAHDTRVDQEVAPAASSPQPPPQRFVEHPSPGEMPASEPPPGPRTLVPGGTSAPARRVGRSSAAATAQEAGSALLLDQEIAVLSRARSALRAGDAATCLSATQEYFKRFRRGVLRAEARVLHIEALQQSGATREARAEARAFLLRFPQSSHRERFEQLGLSGNDAAHPR